MNLHDKGETTTGCGRLSSTTTGCGRNLVDARDSSRPPRSGRASGWKVSGPPLAHPQPYEADQYARRCITIQRAHCCPVMRVCICMHRCPDQVRALARRARVGKVARSQMRPWSPASPSLALEPVSAPRWGLHRCTVPDERGPVGGSARRPHKRKGQGCCPLPRRQPLHRCTAGAC